MCALALLSTTMVVSGAGATTRAGEATVVTRPAGAGPIPIALDGSPAGVVVDVPDELAPTELTGRLVVPPEVVDGLVHVSRDGRPLGTVVVPDRDDRAGDPTVAVRVPLGDEPDPRDAGRRIALELRADVRTRDDGTCPAANGGLVLHDAEVTYATVADGDPTLADAFGSTIEQVTIVAGDDPTPAEARAALAVAASVVHLDPRHATEVRLAPEAPRQADVLERVVVVEQTESDPETTATRLDGGGIRLDLTGDAEALGDTARALGAGALDAIPRASTGGLDHTPTATEARTRLPLGDLAATGPAGTRLAVEGNGSAEVSVAVAAWSLGGERRVSRIRVLATQTPAGEGAVSRLSIRVGGYLVRSVIVDGDHVDEVVDVPAHLAGRRVVLSVEVEHVPEVGGPAACTAGAAVGLTVDPRSWVESVPWSAPGGLERFPQAAAHGLTVGFDELDPGRLAAAVEIVAELQRLAPSPLSPAVAPWSDVPTRRAAALVVAADPDRLAELLQRSDLSDLDEGTLVGDARHATILAGTSTGSGRRLLVAAGPDVDALDRIGSTIRRLPAGLGDLTGERIVLTAQGMGEVRATPEQAAVAPPSPSSTPLVVAARVAGLVALAAFVAVATLVARASYVRRARRSASARRGLRPAATLPD